MAKQVQTWSKPDGVSNLIAKKKVDYSVLSPGSIYISRTFKQDFLEANQGIDIEDGKVRKLTLIINGKKYSADLRCNFSPNAKGERRENLQIRYDGNSELKNLLMHEFTYSNQYIKNEQERTAKISVKLPDDIAEYIEFYKTDTPFNYELKLIKSTSQMMGYPFRSIFNNADEVRWTFHFARKMLIGIGVTSADSESFSITLPEKQNAIHINYQAWRLFGIKRRENSILVVEIACKDKYAQKQNMQRIFDFKQSDDEQSIGIYSMDFSDLKNCEHALIDLMNDTWLSIKERFSTHLKTRYSNSNVKDLAEAIFDEESLEYIIENGIDSESIPIDKKVKYPLINTNDQNNTWIFQANPRIYDIEKAVKNIDDMSWPISRYKDRIRIGDKVFIWVAGKESGIIATAVITSNPAMIPQSDKELAFYIKQELQDSELPRVNISIRSIVNRKLTRENIKKHAVLKKLHIIKNPIGINFYVSSEQSKVIETLISSPPIDDCSTASKEEYQENSESYTNNVEETMMVNPAYSIQQCAEALGIIEDTIERWIGAIERKKQAVIYGPPGTGKTYAAKHLAELLVTGGDGIIEIVQFHPAYAYEDFIMGIRPVTEGGTLTYNHQQGRFVNFCMSSKQKQGNCVLIIDKINRANLSRVFGELMYLLEYRNQYIPLLNGTLFSIPQNVYVIGTMNTADRSIAIVDHAIRRRFAFLEMNVNYDVLEKFHKDGTFPIKKLIHWLKRINEVIDDKRYSIGISFFLLKNLRDYIQDIWEMEIIPYLEEYFFDQPDKVKEFAWENVEDTLL